MSISGPFQPSLHADDIVARRTDESQLAVVDRTSDDVDTHVPLASRDAIGGILRDKDIPKRDFNKFLKDGIPPRGTVMIQWQNDIRPELIQESKLKVLDRSLLPGDVVKRRPQDAMSGIVITTKTKCTLQPVGDLTLRDQYHLQGFLPSRGAGGPLLRRSSPGTPSPLIDIPLEELRSVTSPPQEDDLVIYQNWFGQTVHFTYLITLKLSDNCVVEIDDNLASHADRAAEYFEIGDVATTTKGHLRLGRWIYGRYNPQTPPVGTVVETRMIAVDVDWLHRSLSSLNAPEPDLSFERDEFESAGFHRYNVTRRPPSTAGSAEDSTLTNSELHLRLSGSRLRFKDLNAACAKYDGSTRHGKLNRLDRKDTLGYDMNVFEVSSFSTDVTIQWQDLTITHERSIDLIPETDLDDSHGAWPGEVVHTLALSPVPGLEGVKQPAKVGIVQSVNAEERMARVKWCPSACIQYLAVEGGQETPKMLLSRVVGVAEGEGELLSLYDLEAPGELNVRRGDMVLIQRTESLFAGATSNESTEVDWIGEIVDTRLDGTLVVRLGAASPTRDIIVKREEAILAIRSDEADQENGWPGEGMSDLIDDEDALGLLGEHEGIDRYMNGGYDDVDYYDPYGGASDYDDVSSAEEEPMASYEDENGRPMDEDEVDNPDWESDEGDGENGDVSMVDAWAQSTSSPISSPQTQQPTVATNHKSEASSEPPEAYAILDGAVPASHNFANQPSSENSNHMKRTQKEHKILRSSGALPKGVYVRTWESRLDLLRVLIIGPEDTPYADAPFVIDFYLPSTFPTEPPQAYFHSWPSDLGGIGRVNPNLYEDGKICLSILGTWEGSKGEGWNAARSTMLQVIVSLLGLVLVREPYFNEAGYEPLVGLESYKRPSALYSERIFLRSKTFIIYALNHVGGSEGASGGCEGVGEVLRWLYKEGTGPGLLHQTIVQLEEVLRRSEGGDGGDPDGLTTMSKGLCIPLQRVLERLRAL